MIQTGSHIRDQTIEMNLDVPRPPPRSKVSPQTTCASYQPSPRSGRLGEALIVLSTMAQNIRSRYAEVTTWYPTTNASKGAHARDTGNKRAPLRPSSCSSCPSCGGVSYSPPTRHRYRCPSCRRCCSSCRVSHRQKDVTRRTCKQGRAVKRQFAHRNTEKQKEVETRGIGSACSRTTQRSVGPYQRCVETRDHPRTQG